MGSLLGSVSLIATLHRKEYTGWRWTARDVEITAYPHNLMYYRMLWDNTRMAMDGTGRCHGSSYRAARSAFPAVGLDPTGLCRESGKTGCEWRDSRAHAAALSVRLWSSCLSKGLSPPGGMFSVPQRCCNTRTNGLCRGRSISTIRTSVIPARGRSPGYPASIKGTIICPASVASLIASLQVTIAFAEGGERIRKTGSGQPLGGSRKK